LTQKIRNSEVVYILKSTWYPDFRQKILTLLSLPKDLDFTIEYDEKYLSKEIKANLGKFEGKTACVIFLDYSSKIPKFYPIRICKIVEIIPPTDGVTYQLTLSAENLIVPIDYQKFNSRVYEFLKQQNGIDKDEQGNEYISSLVLFSDKTILDMTSTGINQEEVWEKTVEHLVNVAKIKRLEDQPQFTKSIFFRLKILPRKKLKSPLTPKDRIYTLDQGNEYCLVLGIYNPHFENFDINDFRKLIIDFDTKLVSHVGSVELDLPLRQRKYTKYFDFHTKEPIVSGKSQLTIRGDKDDFNAPFVRIPFVLPTKKREVIGIFSSLVMGIFILGATDIIGDLIASLFNVSEAELSIRLALSIIGTILSALPIAWLEIKRRIF